MDEKGKISKHIGAKLNVHKKMEIITTEISLRAMICKENGDMAGYIALTRLYEWAITLEDFGWKRSELLRRYNIKVERT